jgi:hypothetical protein
MVTGLSGKSKLMLVLMVGMIGVRLSIFALSMVGIIAWAPAMGGASVLSWIVPVGMPIVMISYMLLFRRRGMMRQMTQGSDNATAVASFTPQLLPPMMAMQRLLSKKSHTKRNVVIVAGIIGFMVSMHVLVFGGFLIRGSMAPFGIVIILTVMVIMFVFSHSGMTLRRRRSKHSGEDSLSRNYKGAV